jgi:hypothetical protein
LLLVTRSIEAKDSPNALARVLASQLQRDVSAQNCKLHVTAIITQKTKAAKIKCKTCNQVKVTDSDSESFIY